MKNSQTMLTEFHGSRRKKNKTRRSPGRPVHCGEDVASLLINTAGQIVAERGFRAMTLKILGERAGVNPAMVSYYFKSKEGLCTALIRHHSHRIDEVLATLSLEPERGVEFWEQLSERLLNLIDQFPTAHKIYLWASLEGGQFFENMNDELWMPFRGRIKTWFIETHPQLNESEAAYRTSLYCGLLNQYAAEQWTQINNSSFTSNLDSKSYRALVCQALLALVFPSHT